MRHAILMVLIIFMMPLSSIVSAEDEVIVGDELDTLSIMENYSISVRLAFDRVSNLESYTTEELHDSKEWLVVTSIPISEHEKTHSKPISSKVIQILPGSFVWELEGGEKPIERLSEALEIGEIESFSPLVERTHEERYLPNDPELSSQWHLDNYGQTGGVSGEDANLTGAWYSYNCSGVVISIVDDGLDISHPDISPNYDQSASYDWCNDDSDPTPLSFDGHGTAAAGVAAAAGNNSLYVSGAAFGASVAGSNLISCSISDYLESQALSYENDYVDIYSNSWGPTENAVSYTHLTQPPILLV